MTVTEAIEQLKLIKDAGHGEAILRTYSDYAQEFYPPCEITLHLAADNPGNFDESYGTWVELG